MAIPKNLTIGQVSAIVGILVPLVSLTTWGVSRLATKAQVAEIRNELLIKHTETQISLLYIKNDNKQIDHWGMEDLRAYNSLREDEKKYEAIRKKLSGIPEGLPD